MPDNKYISASIENGSVFDTLVGNLLALRLEDWGWSEQDYDKISIEFSVASNDLFFLPIGNYRMLNFPISLLPNDLGITAIESVNLKVYVKDDSGTKYYILDVNNKSYLMSLSGSGLTPSWKDLENVGSDGEDMTLIHVGETAPENTNMIWIDTSKLITEDLITMKIYDTTSATWKEYTITGAMNSSIYDPTGKKQDPFKYVMNAIEVIIGDYAEFIKHKNNELVLIHVTSEEKEYYNTVIISIDIINEMLQYGGDIYNSLIELIATNTAETIGTENFINQINDLESLFNEHAGATHISESDILSWDSKAPADHTHEYDPNVIINAEDISGDLSTLLGDTSEAKERVKIVTSDAERLALTKPEIHNGCSVCVDDGVNEPVWYKVIDDTKLNIEDGYKKFATTVTKTTFDMITNPPNTLEGYGITDGVSKDELKEIENKIDNEIENITFVPTGYDKESVGESELYVGIQKTLGDGGGTSNYPMSFSKSLLDILVYKDGNLNVDKFANTQEIGSPILSFKENHSFDSLEPALEDIPYTSFVYGNGIYLIYDGTPVNGGTIAIYRSIDLISFDMITIDGLELQTTMRLGNILFINGIFIMLCEVSKSTTCIYTSSDGLKWNKSVLSENKLQASVIDGSYCNNTYCLLSWYNIYTITSSNGVDWTYTLLPEELYAYSFSITNDNEKFIIAGSNGIYTSINGKEWSCVKKMNLNYPDIIYNGSYFILKCIEFNESHSVISVYKSIDLNLWERQSTFIPNNESPNFTIRYIDDNYVIIPFMGLSIIYYSKDCIQWQTIRNYANTRAMAWSIISNKTLTLYIIDPIVDKYNFIDFSFLQIPDSVSGFSKFPSDNVKNDYFTSLYSSDDQNPKFTSDGLGAMIKVDTSQNNIVYQNTYNIAEKDINILIGWDMVKGLYFKHDIVEGINSINSIYNVLMNNGDPLNNWLNDKYKELIDITGKLIWKETSNGLSEGLWWSICYGNGKYVTIANGSNTFAYSTDGITWTETSNGLSNRGWYSICYGNDKYVAIASNSNTFAYSTDGNTWTETSNGLSERDWRSICYGNGKYVAIANRSNTIAYSIDGITWTETLNGLNSRYWRSICYGNGKYVEVAFSSNTFAYSTDGITWTETSNGLNRRDWQFICYGNGKYVAIANGSNTFAYSTDGITWIETSNGLTNRRWNSICYGNGKYVAIAENSNTFAYSTDGITWIETSNRLTNRRWNSICYGNGKYVAIAYISNTFAYTL